jgi:ParB family transcriptional regulator, chromosome partitioning protein
MAMAGEPTRRLGRGLDALLGGYGAVAQAENADAGQRTVPISLIHPNPRNPRRDFDPDELDGLAESLRAHGLVQPIVVRPAGGGSETYEIIAGERRWRAAQKAGLHEVPVVVLPVSDAKALELAIVENVQRTDLNPVEEAMGYRALMEAFEYSQADLGAAVGKSRAHIANTLRLLKLPEAVLAALEAGALSAGHARALVTAADPERLARRIIERGLSVREAERLAQAAADDAGGTTRPTAREPVKDADTRALERSLSDVLGLRVDLRHRPDGGGEMRIRYRDLDQLEALCRRLRG